MVKFDRATIQSWFAVDSNITFVVEGKFLDGRRFEGKDTSVRVINTGVVHTNEASHGSVQQ